MTDTTREGLAAAAATDATLPATRAEIELTRAAAAALFVELRTTMVLLAEALPQDKAEPVRELGAGLLKLAGIVDHIFTLAASAAPESR